MMVTDKEVLDAIHVNLHALRMQQKYKPSQFEMKISYLISSLYEKNCAECKIVMEDKRRQIESQISGNAPQKKGGWFSGVGEILGG